MTVTKKIIIPTAPDGTWRRCIECVHSNRECNFCEKKNIRTSKVMYACPDFATPEEELKRRQHALLIKKAKEERMLDYVLTAMCNCATATQCFLIDFCSFFEKRKKHSDWAHKKAWAANEIIKASERIQTLHAQFFQEDMNRANTDKGTKEFNHEFFDNHQKDAYELCRLLMLYIDRCWGNEEFANKIVEFIESLETGNIFTDDDIERFRLRG